jgi:hypothetical protein
MASPCCLLLCAVRRCSGVKKCAAKADGQNNGNNRQYRNKIVCVGCTARTLFPSIIRYSVVCLGYAVPVSIHYRLCLVTARTKVPQNGRLATFSKRTDFWCAFSWSISYKNIQFDVLLTLYHYVSQ